MSEARIDVTCAQSRVAGASNSSPSAFEIHSPAPYGDQRSNADGDNDTAPRSTSPFADPAIPPDDHAAQAGEAVRGGGDDRGSPRAFGRVPRLSVSCYAPAPVNPFTHDTHLHSGKLQTLKMVVVGMILFIPRVLLICFGVVLMYIAAVIRNACYARAPGPNGETMPMGGSSLYYLGRFAARLVMLGFGYWWISVDDRRPERQRQAKRGAPIVVANHTTFIDAFALTYLEGVMAVGKADLLDAPIVGSLARAIQLIPVARENASSRHGVTAEIKRRTRWAFDQPPEVLEEYGEWPPLLVFPEATTTNGKAIIQFKLGAFISLVPIQPIALDYKQRHLDASWVDASNPAMTALRMMCQVYNRLRVTYLPIDDPAVVDPMTGEVEPPTVTAARVRANIAGTLGVPMTEHNFLDVLIGREAGRLRMPLSSFNIEMGKLCGDDKDGGMERTRACLHAFRRADANNDGFLDQTDFAALLGFASPADRVANDMFITAAFNHWDRDRDGRIDFHGFVLLSAAVEVSRLTQEYQQHLAGMAVGDGDGDATAHSRPNSTASSGSRRQRRRSFVRVGGVETHQTSVEAALQEAPVNPQVAAISDELRQAFALSFAAFDTDDDGVIYLGDLVALVSKTAPSVSLPQLRALFAAASANEPSSHGVSHQAADDGDSVTFDEYMRLCERYPILVGSLLDAIALTDALSTPSAQPVVPSDAADAVMSIGVAVESPLVSPVLGPAPTSSNVFLPAVNDSNGTG